MAGVMGRIDGMDDPNFRAWAKQYWPSENMGSAYFAYRSAGSYQSQTRQSSEATDEAVSD